MDAFSVNILDPINTDEKSCSDLMWSRTSSSMVQAQDFVNSYSII